MNHQNMDGNTVLHFCNATGREASGSRVYMIHCISVDCRRTGGVGVGVGDGGGSVSQQRVATKIRP